MIKLHVNLVLKVLDGYREKPLAKSQLRCFLDGKAYMPQYREGGYFVFTNLEEGAHALVLKAAFLQDQAIAVIASADAMQERVIAMNPAPGYPFGGRMTALQGRLARKAAPLAGASVSVAAKQPAAELKIAQDAIEKGAREAKLYTRLAAEKVLAGEYMIIDGKNTELCTLLSYADGVASFAAPLQFEHKRGKALYPARSYLTDENGCFFATFREPARVELFVKGGGTMSAELIEGENRLAFDL